MHGFAIHRVARVMGRLPASRRRYCLILREHESVSSRAETSGRREMDLLAGGTTAAAYVRHFGNIDPAPIATIRLVHFQPQFSGRFFGYDHVVGHFGDFGGGSDCSNALWLGLLDWLACKSRSSWVADAMIKAYSGYPAIDKIISPTASLVCNASILATEG